jgi:phasin family protein
MFATNEQFSKLSLNGFESALRFAQISLDSTERLIKFGLEVSKQSLEENVKAARDLSGVQDPQEVFKRVSQIASGSIEQAVTNSRNVYEIVSRAQGEITRLTEENVGNFNKALISSIESFAKNSPAGSDVALNTVKTTIAAAAAAVNSLTKAAQQAAEFADSSVKAASTATAEAVKSTAKRASNA